MKLLILMKKTTITDAAINDQKRSLFLAKSELLNTYTSVGCKAIVLEYKLKIFKLASKSLK